MYVTLQLIKYSLLFKCWVARVFESTSASLFNFELLSFIDFSSRPRLFWHLAFTFHWLLSLMVYNLFRNYSRLHIWAIAFLLWNTIQWWSTVISVQIFFYFTIELSNGTIYFERKFVRNQVAIKKYNFSRKSNITMGKNVIILTL